MSRLRYLGRFLTKRARKQIRGAQKKFHRLRRKSSSHLRAYRKLNRAALREERVIERLVGVALRKRHRTFGSKKYKKQVSKTASRNAKHRTY